MIRRPDAITNPYSFLPHPPSKRELPAADDLVEASLTTVIAQLEQIVNSLVLDEDFRSKCMQTIATRTTADQLPFSFPILDLFSPRVIAVTAVTSPPPACYIEFQTGLDAVNKISPTSLDAKS